MWAPLAHTCSPKSHMSSGRTQSWGPRRTCLSFSLLHPPSRWDSTRPDLLSILSLATWGQGLVRPGPWPWGRPVQAPRADGLIGESPPAQGLQHMEMPVSGVNLDFQSPLSPQAGPDVQSHPQPSRVLAGGREESNLAFPPPPASCPPSPGPGRVRFQNLQDVQAQPGQGSEDFNGLLS